MSLVTSLPELKVNIGPNLWHFCPKHRNKVCFKHVGCHWSMPYRIKNTQQWFGDDENGKQIDVIRICNNNFEYCNSIIWLVENVTKPEGWELLVAVKHCREFYEKFTQELKPEMKCNQFVRIGDKFYTVLKLFHRPWLIFNDYAKKMIVVSAQEINLQSSLAAQRFIYYNELVNFSAFDLMFKQYQVISDALCETKDDEGDVVINDNNNNSLSKKNDFVNIMPTITSFFIAAYQV